jgi:hypothetical protein
MKRTVPLLITSIVGFVLIGSAFVPIAETWSEKALIWFDILAGIAFVLGGANLVASQLKKISRRRSGWGYALITLLSFLGMLSAGLLKILAQPATNQEFFGETFSPVPVAALPEFSVDTPVSDDIRHKTLPASASRQTTLEPGAIRFRGWMSPRQVTDLKEFNPRLEWQCAIERLAESARPPESLRGRLHYYSDHRSLGFVGWMNEADEKAVASLSNSPEYMAAVAKIAEVSRRETTVESSPPPSGFEPPATLQEVLTIGDGRLTIRGPMSSTQRSALAQSSLDSRRVLPPNAAGRETILGELRSRGSPNEAQTKAAKVLLTEDLSDAFIAAVNSAGATKPKEKTACEMLAERNAGATDISPTTPAEPAVTLTAAQETVVREFFAAADPGWAAFQQRLADAAPLTPAQIAAVESFRQTLPTLGDRNRSLFDELIKQGPVAPEQREYLLAPYREEIAWKNSVSRLFFAAHEVKYPWSGEFNHQGTAFWWLYEYVLQPITSTMFALLAFYVASAAFRAFRAKNLEATLLLGTAFVILLGRTYAGVLITGWIPPNSSFAFLRLENLAVYIMKLFNAAGNRAIMIGIALGIASTSLKILLGIDRSHVGGRD